MPPALRPTLVALAAAITLLAGGIAAGAPQAPPPFAESGVLTVGSRGPAVTALQRELRRRGLPVRADGRFGPRTRLSVARLQKRMGLRVNGIVDRPLLWWLGISVCALPGPTTARGAVKLRLGAYGPRVCTLQRMLVRSGMTVAVDGGYGPETRRAVRTAQRRVGLPATGVADTRLVARLRARPRGPGTSPGAALSVGAQGPRVRGLQVALLRRGMKVDIDGVYGPATRTAVVRTQRKLGLPASGTADRGLLRRIGAGRPNRLVAFPVSGPHAFSDDFGAPRHQGPHEGNDIIAPRGAPIVAVDNGVIERMTRVERGLGGIWIWLRADDGTGFYYAHLSRITAGLAPGSRVRAGQRIGDVGMTGDARGTVFHLHFEMHPPNRGAVDPYVELRAADAAATAT